jgi:hypothetical protein
MCARSCSSRLRVGLLGVEGVGEGEEKLEGAPGSGPHNQQVRPPGRNQNDESDDAVDQHCSIPRTTMLQQWARGCG